MPKRLALFLLSLSLFVWTPASRPASAQADEGFESIFDGKTLGGWDGNPKFWSVRDGAITGQTTPDNPTDGNTFIIWRGGEVADFELKLQYRIVDGNSGIQYRSFEIPGQKWVVGGYQADFEAGDRYSGIVYGERFRGILANRGEETVIREGGKVEVVGQVGVSQEIQAKIKKEDWNEYHIVAQGNHFVHRINGVVTAKTTDLDSARRAEGILALQLHQGPPMTVQFRNIRLKRTEATAEAAKKKVVFVAGTKSHGYGAHEHNAGCLLLAKSLQQGMPNIEVELVHNGWPRDESVFDGADTVVMYADGGDRHPVNPHLSTLDRLADKGVGVVCIHYAVEVPKGPSGDHLLKWIGGYFEKHWSVNPHWTAKFTQLPEHPITRGVEPFEINDEWYFHMRFREGMEGVTPILTALPGPDTLTRPDGPHHGNPHVRAAVLQRKEPQHMAWASERPNGQRGFGFTGGHVHWNWGDPNFRKLVLNAIVWSAHGEVPADGVADPRVTLPQLEANQDYEPPKDFNRGEIQRLLDLSAAGMADHDSAQAVAQLDVHPQLEATLFAAEPMMLSPSNIDVDHLGRVWVCEVVNYRRFRNTHFPEREAGDQILILEDTDGDGRADKKTTFYQGRDVDSAHGVCVLPTATGKGTRALVSAKDSVFYLIDEDGDLRADKKQLLFTGIGGAEHDHGIHAFVFGPDGKLYFNFGNEGKQLRDASGQLVVDQYGNRVEAKRRPYQEGMVFRCNMDGSQFETLAWNFRNNWEICCDSFGNLWQSDNDDDGNRGTRINFVLEFGNYGYKDQLTGASWKQERTGMHAEIPLRHWHLNDPGVVPNLLQTGAGSPTGILVYEGKLLPPPFQGQVIHSDAGPNIVRAYPVREAGAGYAARVIPILDGKANQWFRPSDVCVAPDGSLLVADWYDPGVGGHRMEDAERGRLFRVTPKGRQARYQAPRHDFSTTSGAVKALASPNLATRYLAWTTLHERQAEAETALVTVYKSAEPRQRARALWLLGNIPGRAQHYVDMATADQDAKLRIVGVRLARQLKLNVLEVVEQLMHDPSPQVRRELAIALRHQLPSADRPSAARLWSELALQYDGQDRWYLEALGIGADLNWDACLAAWLERVDGNWSTSAGRDILWRSRAKKTPQYLAKILADEATPVETHARYFRAFDFLTGPEKDQALKTLLGL